MGNIHSSEFELLYTVYIYINRGREPILYFHSKERNPRCQHRLRCGCNVIYRRSSTNLTLVIQILQAHRCFDGTSKFPP